jgi:hypothetical protein
MRRAGVIAVVGCATWLAACGDSAAGIVSGAARAESEAVLTIRASSTEAVAGGSNWQWFAPPLASVRTEKLGPVTFKALGNGRLIATARHETIRVTPGVAGDADSASVQRVVGGKGVSMSSSVSVEIGENGTQWQQTGNLGVEATYGGSSETAASVAARRAVRDLFAYHGSVAGYNATQALLYVTTAGAANRGYASAPPTTLRFSGQDDDAPGPPVKVVGYSLPSFGQATAAASTDGIGTLLSPGCGAGEVPTTMAAEQVVLAQRKSVATMFPTYMFTGSVNVETGPWTGYVEGTGDYSMTAKRCPAVTKVVKFQIGVTNTPLHGWLVDYLALPGLVQADSPGNYVGQLYEVCARPGDSTDLPTC